MDKLDDLIAVAPVTRTLTREDVFANLREAKSLLDECLPFVAGLVGGLNSSRYRQAHYHLTQAAYSTTVALVYLQPEVAAPEPPPGPLPPRKPG